MTHEGSVAGHAESCDIGHHVICAMRRKAFEPGTLQTGRGGRGARRTPWRGGCSSRPAGREPAPRPAAREWRRPPSENRGLCESSRSGRAGQAPTPQSTSIGDDFNLPDAAVDFDPDLVRCAVEGRADPVSVLLLEPADLNAARSEEHTSELQSRAYLV